MSRFSEPGKIPFFCPSNTSHFLFKVDLVTMVDGFDGERGANVAGGRMVEVSSLKDL